MSVAECLRVAECVAERIFQIPFISGQQALCYCCPIREFFARISP